MNLAICLTRHPATPCTAVQSITVELERGAAWRLRYHIRGWIDQLVVPCTTVGARLARDDRAQGALPQESPAARRDGLWQHTCCELFIADSTGHGYREYNFAPSGEWAAYRFDDYRAGMHEHSCKAPCIEVRCSAEEFVLEATLTNIGPVGALGLCCVIEERDGRISHWALAHPGERADFHHRDGFLLESGHTA